MPPSVLELPPRRKVARSFYRRWSWRRQIIRSGTRLLILAVVVLLFLGGWYLANKGFGRQWRTTVADELRKRGVEASVRKLTLDPFRGLVAQDVRIYDFKNHEQPIAVISELSLDINYAALLHRQPFLNAVDIRNANVTFPDPGGDPRAPKATLRNFRAHVYFPPEQIFISQAEGNFCGVRVSATGQLLMREAYKPERVVSEEEWRQRWQRLQRLAAELRKFTFIGGAPTLQVKFSGDVAEMENGRIEATLQGDRMQRPGYEIKTLRVAAEWMNQRFTLTQLEWTDAWGVGAARASWSLPEKRGDFQLQSTTNLREAAAAFGFNKQVADLTFATPPQIDLSGSFNLAGETPRFSALGAVTCGDFSYKDIPFLGVSADFSWDGAHTMLRDVRLRHASGEVAADLLETPNDFRLTINSSMNPIALRPLVEGDLAKFMGDWECPRAPEVRLTIRGTSHDPDTWHGEGTLALPRARFRGVWMNSASADMSFGDKAVNFENLRVTRDEGVGTGAFTYDFGHHEVRVRDVKTTLRPSAAMSWIEPNLLKVVTPYIFHGVPHLTANGVVQYHGGEKTHLEIGIEAPTGLDYVFLGKTLGFNRATGRLLITDDRVQVLDLDGKLFNGTVRGDIDVSTAKHEAEYHAKIAVDGIDFPRVTKLYFDYETSRGQLSGSYDFTGVSDVAKAMQGEGKVQVSNGNIFAIPVLGPLSGFVSAIIPGAGYSQAKDASANFTISDGVIKTENFKVAGKLFSIVGHGKIFFLEDKIDFDVHISADGPGVLLTPVYKLFEYKGEGSLAKPNWHPKRF